MCCHSNKVMSVLKSKLSSTFTKMFMIIWLIMVIHCKITAEYSRDCFPLEGEYKGTLNITRSGHRCVSWNTIQRPDWQYVTIVSSIPESPGLNVRYYPEKHSYCRKQHRTFPFCFYTELQWDVCDVPVCPSLRSSFRDVVRRTCVSSEDCGQVEGELCLGGHCICPETRPLLVRSVHDTDKFQCVNAKLLKTCQVNADCLSSRTPKPLSTTAENDGYAELTCSELSHRCFCPKLTVLSGEPATMGLLRPDHGIQMSNDRCISYRKVKPASWHHGMMKTVDQGQPCSARNCDETLTCFHGICVCPRAARNLLTAQQYRLSCIERQLGYMQPCNSDWDCKRNFRCSNFTFENGAIGPVCKCAEGEAFHSLDFRGDQCIACTLNTNECSCPHTWMAWDGHKCRPKPVYMEQCSALMPCRQDQGLMCTAHSPTTGSQHICTCGPAAMWDGWRCITCRRDEIEYGGYCISVVDVGRSWSDAEDTCLSSDVNSSLMTFKDHGQLMEFSRQVFREYEQSRKPWVFQTSLYYIGYKVITLGEFQQRTEASQVFVSNPVGKGSNRMPWSRFATRFLDLAPMTTARSNQQEHSDSKSHIDTIRLDGDLEGLRIPDEDLEEFAKNGCYAMKLSYQLTSDKRDKSLVVLEECNRKLPFLCQRGSWMVFPPLSLFPSVSAQIF